MESDEVIMNTAPEIEDSDAMDNEEKATEEETSGTTAPEIEDSDAMDNEEKATEEETSGTTATSSFIQELNLVLILAFLSLSADEQLDFEEIKQTTHEFTDSKGKPSVSSSQFRRRQLNIDGFRNPERQISRSHSKIQDCRHGRRV